MFLLRKPSDSQIGDYLSRQAEQPYSYEDVGCTRDQPRPRAGWNIDQHRVLLGHGEAAFYRAKQAIETWRMFPRKVANISNPQPPREGLIVAVLYWAAPLRLWLLFPARVVYFVADTIKHDGQAIDRFGFAYGTLPNHPERGEERFLVEWNKSDNSVWYDLLAVSQPRHWLARLGYPYTRYEQARFRQLSGTAMQQVAKADSAPA